MAETSVPEFQSQSRLRRLLQNPVTIKELRGRMRGRRAFVVLTIYLTVMSGFLSLVYLSYAAAADNPFGPSSRQAGKVVFGAVLAIQIFLVVYIGPAFTTGAITGEKERQTYDLLRTTLLSANSFVIGKILSALSYVLLLIFAAIPLQSIAFLLGGVSPIELVLAQLLIVVTAIAYALLGLFFSSLMRSTLAASVTTFAAALVLTAGAPTIAILFMTIFGTFLFGPGTPSWPVMATLVYGGMFLAATNLPATIILSEVFLLQQNTLFFFKEVIDGHIVYLFSPWYVYIVLYSLLALFLYWVCVRRVRRIADK